MTLIAFGFFLVTGLVTAGPAMTAQAQTSGPTCTPVSTANLTAHWKLDDGTGTIAADSSGGGHAGTVNNGAVWLTGSASVMHANALSFDGNDDYVNVPAADFSFGTGSFTVSAFMKGTTANRGVLGNYSLANRGWGLYLYPNGVNFFGYGTMGTNDMSKSAVVLDNNWHHVAGVYTRTGDNLTIATYVDGVIVGTHTAAVGNITSNSDFLLGKYQGQPSFQGALDDVRVYGRALTNAEVDSLADGCGDATSSSSSSQTSSSSSTTSSSSSSTSSTSSSSSVSSSSSSSSTSIGDAPMCNGKAATIFVTKRKHNRDRWWEHRGNGQLYIVGGPMNGQPYRGVLRGTDGNDVIVGTNKADVIGAKGGDDTVCSDKGNDFIYGDAGMDTVFAGNGRNIVLGNLGDDTITVGNGNNIIDGGEGTNTCNLGHGHNIVFRCNGQEEGDL